jgi:TPR repeat protein
MFSYAAAFFADPVAQYELGRMYLDGVGGAKDPKQAARWFYQAAIKGDYHARAAFGSLLLKGSQGVPRDGAMGLMWLKLAAEAAPAGETGIAELYNTAAKKASRQEREAAEAYVRQLRESGEK